MLAHFPVRVVIGRTYVRVRHEGELIQTCILILGLFAYMKGSFADI